MPEETLFEHAIVMQNNFDSFMPSQNTLMLLHVINDSMNVSIHHVSVMVDHPQVCTHIIINILQYTAEYEIKMNSVWSYNNVQL